MLREAYGMLREAYGKADFEPFLDRRAFVHIRIYLHGARFDA